MIGLAKNILDVAKILLGLSDQLRAAEKQRRLEMANLFESISSCLANVSGEIRVGNIPHGSCSELITYSEALPGFTDKELGDAKARELAETLRSAYNVEQMAMDLHEKSDKEPYLKEIEEASGKFSALANILRVG